MQNACHSQYVLEISAHPRSHLTQTNNPPPTLETMVLWSRRVMEKTVLHYNTAILHKFNHHQAFCLRHTSLEVSPTDLYRLNDDSNTLTPTTKGSALFSSPNHRYIHPNMKKSIAQKCLSTIQARLQLTKYTGSKLSTILGYPKCWESI